MKDIGSILRKQRLAIGLEIGDIAKQTCICSRYICAMEEGRFQSIPSVYGKGYLKIYAGLLKLDMPTLLTLYENNKKAMAGSVNLS
jgi:cytoskeletal protein RodZ